MLLTTIKGGVRRVMTYAIEKRFHTQKLDSRISPWWPLYERVDRVLITRMAMLVDHTVATEIREIWRLGHSAHA